MQKKLLFIIGTRPEAIKMAPLILKSKEYKNCKTIVCITAQHRGMLDQVLNFFNIIPHYDLNLMKPNQDLFDITTSGLMRLKTVLEEATPDLVFVQGDTTTAFIGALAAFYHKTRIVHIEAGLRSGNVHSPYPEEMYRILTGQLTNYHFVPTQGAADNLKKENIKENIYIVGNTVIDALFLGLDLIKNTNENIYYEYFNFINFNQKIILITSHRRENFGKPLQDICTAIKLLAIEYPDIQFIYPVHPNPNVKLIVNKMLGKLKNIFLIEPLDYSYMIWLMEKSYIIITDSGGIQEESPSLGKPVLVIRNVTERVEGVEAGTAKLVGTSTDIIINEVQNLLNNENYYHNMAQATNPYGDGQSCKYIFDILEKKIFSL